MPSGNKPFLLLVDGVTDPGNLGALLRTAECAGVTGVVLPRHRAAHVTPTVTKSAAGAIEHLRMATVPGMAGALTALSARDVWTVGLDAAASTSLFDLTLAERGGRARVGCRRCGTVQARAAALRRAGLDPAARPAQLPQRLGRGRVGLLRGHAPARVSGLGWQLVVDWRALGAAERELLIGELWCHSISGIEERDDDVVVGFATEVSCSFGGERVGRALDDRRSARRCVSRRVAPDSPAHGRSTSCSCARRGSMRRRPGPRRSRSSSTRSARSAAARTRRLG